MLKLRRNYGDRIIVDNDIVIEHCGFTREGDTIIGVKADGMEIVREEIKRPVRDNDDPLNEKLKRWTSSNQNE